MKCFPVVFLLLFLFSCNNAADTNTAATEATEEAKTSPIRGIVDVNPLNDPTPLPEMINFTSLAPGGNLYSPHTLKGRAIGSWYHEGDFPITIVGEDGTVIASAPATAKGDWMQEGWVPYEAVLEWDAEPNTKAKLVFTLNNPADEGEGKRRALEIPVFLK